MQGKSFQLKSQNFLCECSQAARRPFRSTAAAALLSFLKLFHTREDYVSQLAPNCPLRVFQKVNN